ncbi:hypothetical protein JW964_23645 [candidate division KSB1 bacterium]|nr:hypothetical protein [candidate division KSB1 bacterium]
MKLIHSSIVFVLKKGFNHSLILNFLDQNQILPPDFVEEPKIYSPAMPTIIDLHDGHSIHILPNKIIIQINYAEPGELNELDAIPDELLKIAENVVPHISKLDIKALGINFKLVSSADKEIENLSNLPIDSEILEIKFQLRKDIFLLINTINRVAAEGENGLLFDSNFHLDLNENNTEALILEYLAKRGKCFQQVKGLINEIFKTI